MSYYDPLTAAIVDAYSVGKYLPAAFQRLGARVVHVQSTTRPIPTVPPPDLTPYLGNVIHTESDETVKRLAEFAPVCVVPGQETGVPLADLLSELIGLPGNGTALSAARRDKYEMIETLRTAGIRCARQWKSSDADEIVAWAEKLGEYPVVVKPLSSASTDGVSICHSPHQVRAAATAVLGSRDIFNRVNTEVLVQSFLDGTEYVVDVVCCAGGRHVCGVWRYEKTDVGTKRVYDKDILLAPDDDVAGQLVAYLDTVLEALRIRTGAAHAEIMMTADGPVLVEIGARLNGNMDPGFHNLCLDGNQADLLALSYLRPAEFISRHDGKTLYRKKREAVVCNVQGVQDGVVTGLNEDILEKIRALDTVHLAVPRVAVGGRIRPTTDLASSPLRVFLADESYERIMADYGQMMAIKDDVYRVSRPAA